MEVRKLTSDSAKGIIIISNSKEAIHLSPHLAQPLEVILYVRIPPETMNIPILVTLYIRKGTERVQGEELYSILLNQLRQSAFAH